MVEWVTMGCCLAVTLEVLDDLLVGSSFRCRDLQDDDSDQPRMDHLKHHAHTALAKLDQNDIVAKHQVLVLCQD